MVIAAEDLPSFVLITLDTPQVFSFLVLMRYQMHDDVLVLILAVNSVSGLGLFLVLVLLHGVQFSVWVHYCPFKLYV